MTDLNICVMGDGLVKGVGDPTGRGWAGLLAEEVMKGHGPVNYYNLGVPGQSSADVFQRLGELVPRLPLGDDNRLILSFGLIDALGTATAEPLSAKESLTHLREILAKVHSHYKLLMVGPPPVYDPAMNARVKRINLVFKEFCLKARVPYIDIYSPLMDDVQYRRDLVQGDRVHPSGRGHAKIFDLISNDRSWWFG